MTYKYDKQIDPQTKEVKWVRQDHTNYNSVRDQREMLKIKILSLMAEHKIIRQFEERDNGGWLSGSMRQHRNGVLRDEMRHACVATVILRGKSIQDAERNPRVPLNEKKLMSLLNRYGPRHVQWPSKLMYDAPMLTKTDSYATPQMEEHIKALADGASRAKPKPPVARPPEVVAPTVEETASSPKGLISRIAAKLSAR